MNILLYGDDAALMRKKLSGFKSQFLKMYADGEVLTLHGDALPPPDELADTFTTDSLFGSKKLFILKSWYAVLQEKTMAVILPWLIQGGKIHTVIYYEEDVHDVIKTDHFKALQAQKLLADKYIFYCRRARSVTSSVSLTPEQRLYIDQVHADNSALAEQELTKAALLQRAGKADLINQVFTDHQTILSVFPFIDAVFARDPVQTHRILHGLLAQGENELMLLTMLINHVKKVLFIVDAEMKAADINLLLKKMRVHAFVAKKLLQQKKNFTLSLLKSWLTKLLEIDLQAKQGKVDAKVALGQFCVSIDM